MVPTYSCVCVFVCVCTMCFCACMHKGYDAHVEVRWQAVGASSDLPSVMCALGMEVVRLSGHRLRRLACSQMPAQGAGPFWGWVQHAWLSNRIHGYFPGDLRQVDKRKFNLTWIWAWWGGGSLEAALSLASEEGTHSPGCPRRVLTLWGD